MPGSELVGRKRRTLFWVRVGIVCSAGAIFASWLAGAVERVQEAAARTN